MPRGQGKTASHPVKEKEIKFVGHEVCIDLSGMANKASLNGFNYYLLSKDVYSEFVFVDFVREKSDVHKCMEKLIINFEYNSEKSIRGIQSDHGTEFINNNVEKLLLKERIFHKTSSVYTPQQNSIMGREMGSVTNMARIMLLSSNSPVTMA